jgi:hypothetical protein
VDDKRDGAGVDHHGLSIKALRCESNRQVYSCSAG